MSREYQCFMCKGIFECDLTDEELDIQLDNEFLGYIKEECEEVCDDCYKIMEKTGVFKDE